MTSQNGQHGQNGQLSLIETPRPWRLDEHTRQVGRVGVARARAALRSVHGRAQDPPAPARRPARKRAAA